MTSTSAADTPRISVSDRASSAELTGVRRSTWRQSISAPSRVFVSGSSQAFMYRSSSRPSILGVVLPIELRFGLRPHAHLIVDADGAESTPIQRNLRGSRAVARSPARRAGGPSAACARNVAHGGVAVPAARSTWVRSAPAHGCDDVGAAGGVNPGRSAQTRHSKSSENQRTPAAASSLSSDSRTGSSDAGPASAATCSRARSRFSGGSTCSISGCDAQCCSNVES